MSVNRIHGATFLKHRRQTVTILTQKIPFKRIVRQALFVGYSQLDQQTEKTALQREIVQKINDVTSVSP